MAFAIALNLFAAGCYGLIGWLSGYLQHPAAYVFQAPDSRDYREVADWIFGARASSAASIWRPFLYPLLLGASDRLGGAVTVWLLNVALWFAALNFAAAGAHRFVRRRWASALVFVLLATNVSLVLLTFQALTETAVLALLAIWIYGLSRLTPRPAASQVLWALLPLTLLVVVKPEFELLLALVVVLLVIGVLRTARRGLAAAALGASLAPITVQLYVMARFNHYLGISSVGDSTIRGYYLARLYMRIAHTSDFQAAREHMTSFNNPDVIRFVLGHATDAIVVFVKILKDNLTAGSNFILPGAIPHLDTAIVWANRGYVVALVGMVPLVGVALWRARDGRLALLCVAAMNVFFAGGLSFYQGDRLTVIALPLWATALVLAGREAITWRELRLAVSWIHSLATRRAEPEPG